MEPFWVWVCNRKAGVFVCGFGVEVLVGFDLLPIMPCQESQRAPAMRREVQRLRVSRAGSHREWAMGASSPTCQLCSNLSMQPAHSPSPHPTLLTNSPTKALSGYYSLDLSAVMESHLMH